MPGDALQKLGLLQSHLRRLAEVPTKAAPIIADALTLLMKKQAAAGTDPYGKPHAPLRRQRASGRTGPPLVDSGKSYAQTVFYPYREGVAGVLGGKLAYHMLATTNRVARAAFPRGTFPAMWTKAISAAIARVAPRGF